MLDNLRDSASESPFFQEEESPPEGPKSSYRRPSKTLLGLTAFQRFILALLLFFMTCVVGSFLLLITQRVVPNF
jgi:hypothetical protein